MIDRLTIPALLLFAVAALCSAAALLFLGGGAEPARASHAGGMDAMSIDMDPTGNLTVRETACTDTTDNDGDTFINDGCPVVPTASGTAESGANCGNASDDDGDTVIDDGCAETGAQCENAVNDDAATGDTRANDGCTVIGTLGTVEDCARTDPNGIQDADEDDVDLLTFDVTALNIPASDPMTSFSFTLQTRDSGDTVVVPDVISIDVATSTGTVPSDVMLLNGNAGSSIFNSNDAVGDQDGIWTGSSLDTGVTGVPEHKSGTLERITILAVDNTPAVYLLKLTGAFHADPGGPPANLPDALNHAKVAVNMDCPAPPLPPVDTEMIALSLTSLSGPNVPVNTDFTLRVEGTARNNGPNPADIRIELSISGPGDCSLLPVGTQTEDFPNVLSTETRTSTRDWTASCSSPSIHDFSASGLVTVTGLADESTPGNNGPLNAGEPVSLMAEADPKVTSVSVSAPPDAATGAPFDVTVTTNLHNNGLLDPVNVDVTSDLSVPGGCSRVPDDVQVSNDVSLAFSVPGSVQQTWSVTCTTSGLKTFTGTGSLVVDQLHVSDSNGGNNSDQGQASTDTSLGVADVKVISVTVSSPPDSPLDTNFPVTVNTTAHNNGPFFPVNADVTLTLNLPADCFTPVTTIIFDDATLGPSVAAMLPEITFFVACIDHSFHDITATATAVVDDPLAGDPNLANNTATSAPSTTAVLRDADLKAISATLTAPATAITNTPFNVMVDASVHNNGPDDAPADVTMTLVMPGDCTAPNNPRTVNVFLTASTLTALPTETFSVTCTTRSDHDFSATVTVAGPLHVVDGTPANDSVSSGTSSVEVFDLADVKVTGVNVTGPSQGIVGNPFTVTATVSLHNNGPLAPANVDLSTTLTLPADCSTADSNPRDTQDISVPFSVSTPVIVNWSVTCTDKSFHSFSASSTASVDASHVMDPVPGNNTGSSSPTAIPVYAQADGKIMSSLVLSPPAFIAANTDVTITIRKTLHNNGPLTPATFDLSKSITPPAGCTVTPPALSSHTLALSASMQLDEVWTINCVPGTYTFNFVNTLTVTGLHVTDPVAGNNTMSTGLTLSVDTDGDGIPDDVENACGSNPNSGSSVPERVDGAFAGVDDDGIPPRSIDEALPGGASGYDCDRDGYKGADEASIFTPATNRDQDPCGNDGWAPDFVSDDVASYNKINVLDITTYITPVRRLNTSPPPGDYSARWDVVPGPAVPGGFWIDVLDLTQIVNLHPPMLNGMAAFQGPDCPWPPS